MPTTHDAASDDGSEASDGKPSARRVSLLPTPRNASVPSACEGGPCSAHRLYASPAEKEVHTLPGVHTLDDS